MRSLVLFGLIASIGATAFAARDELAAGRPRTGSAGREASVAKPSSKGIPKDAGQTQMSPCACARDNRCWKLVMTFYRQNVSMSKDEIEKAMPNRFFPGTLAWALLHPDANGHFLKVQCGDRRRVCDDRTFELEKRLIISDLLKSLALNPPGDTMFDPNTWAIDAKGFAVYGQVKRCRPGLLGELAAAAQGARPQ